MTSNIFFPVNGKITTTAYVIRLIATEILRGPSSDESTCLFQDKPSAGTSGETRMDQKWYQWIYVGPVKYINLYMLLKHILGLSFIAANARINRTDTIFLEPGRTLRLILIG